MFYCSASYSALGTNAAIRLLFLICAFAWIAFLLIVTPGKRLPAISAVGRRTLPVFLLHGFIQRIILQYGFLRENACKNLLAAAALTLIIVALLSLKPIYRLFGKAFHPERKDYDGIRNADAYRE